MTHIALKLIPENPVAQKFLVARAVSISQYSMLEGSLSRLYSSLMGVPEAIAGIAFFRINNARARNAILERLIKKRFGNTYNIFFNSLEKHLNDLDRTRNNVVHWAIEETMNIDLPPGQQTTSHILAPPNFWDKTENSSQMAIEDLYDFIVKCNFFMRLINVFTWTLEGGPGSTESSREMCLQPITYPPPENHSLKLKA